MGRPTLLLAPAAGFWRRAAAFAVDWTLALIVVGAVAIVASTRVDDEDRSTAVLLLVLGAGLWIVTPLVLAGLTATGGTIGRRLTGLAVVRVADAERARLGDALRREVVGRTLVTTPLVVAGGAGLLGYVWAPRDRLGQTWHDKVGRTTVLDVRRRPPVAQGAEGPVHVERSAPAPGGHVYAEWWPRLGAFIIDFALVATVSGAVIGPIAIALGAGSDDTDEAESAAAVAFVLFLVLQTIGLAVYQALAIGWRETTVGKHAVGLVVRAEDGSRAGYGRAFSRELLGRVLVEGLAGAFLALLAWFASGLSAAADRRRQTWHDKIGQTIVVVGEGERRPRPAPAAPAPAPAVEGPDPAGAPA